MDKADVFVQNVHVNSIKVRADVPDGGKTYRWEKLFPIQTFDYSGREMTTGYTRLTAKEYEICRRDKLFQYFQGIGKLIVSDDLPSSAMTPHEALTSSRKRIRSLQEELERLQSLYRAAVTELNALKEGAGKQLEPESEPSKRKSGGKKPDKPDAGKEANLELAF
jgi:hypothetical protein